MTRETNPEVAAYNRDAHALWAIRKMADGEMLTIQQWAAKYADGLPESLFEQYDQYRMQFEDMLRQVWY